MDFHFPSKILKAEDFAPVQILALKDFYKDSFLQILDKVIQIIF